MENTEATRPANELPNFYVFIDVLKSELQKRGVLAVGRADKISNDYQGRPCAVHFADDWGTGLYLRAQKKGGYGGMEVWGVADQINVSGSYSQDTYSKLTYNDDLSVPSANISLKKSPERIAKEIERRVFPMHVRVKQFQAGAQHEAAQHEEALKRAGAAFVDALPETKVTLGEPDQYGHRRHDPEAYNSRLAPGPHWTAKFIGGYRGKDCKVRFEVSDLPVELAVKIAQLIKESA